MNENTVSSKQIQSIIMMFILGTTLILGVNNQANQDSWISIALAVIMILPMFFVYTAILRLYPGKNLFDIIIEVFGKIAGKIICLTYVLYALHLGSLILRDNSEFIHIVNMPETPQAFTLFFMILLSILTVSIGVINLGRIAKFTFPLVAAAILLTSVMDVGRMDFSNILPVMNTDIPTLLTSSFALFSFPFGEAVLCMVLFSYFNPKDNLKDNPKKIYFKGLVITASLLIIACLRNLFVLGTPTINLLYFPSYMAASVISVGEFFNRVEVLISANLLLATFIKANVCLFASAMGLAKIFNIENYRAMVAPCGLIMVTLSVLTVSNITELFGLIKYYPVYSLPFQVILPIAILVGAVIQKKKKSSKPSSPEQSIAPTQSENSTQN